MINSLYSLKPEICPKHNSEVFAYQSMQPLCFIGLTQLAGVVPIDLYNKKLEEMVQKQDQENQQQHKLFQSLLDSLITYKQMINLQIEKIIIVIMDQIKIIGQQSVQFQNKIEQCNNQKKLVEDLESDFIKSSTSSQSVMRCIKNMINDFQQTFSNYNKSIEELLQQNQRQEFQIQQLQREDLNISRHFKYELFLRSSLKEKTNCFAFAFNKQNNVLIYGCNSNIKIYEFRKGKIQKKLQTLSMHTGNVYCLHFMQESNAFISGSSDKSIIIWNMNQNNQWYVHSVLKAHENYVNCLLMNEREDLLISGSDDYTIRFWGKFNDNWCCMQIIKTDDTISALSLNGDENKLISCGTYPFIQMYEMQGGQEWIKLQSINVAESGYRLCFTIGDQFVYQPKTLNYLEVFKYDKVKKQFFVCQQVQIQSCEGCNNFFPCQFIQQLNILIVKHGKFLNIFRVNQNESYELVQTIRYEHPYHLYGKMTFNGQYLITWDEGTKKLQVQKLKLIE